MNFVIPSLRGEGVLERLTFVILVFVILWWRGGGVELKMHDVILFAVFFFEGVPYYFQRQAGLTCLN